MADVHVPVKLIRTMKICLSANCSKVGKGEHLSDMFPIQSGLKKVSLSRLLFNFASECAMRKETKRD
jgi:hypothetical protein